MQSSMNREKPNRVEVKDDEDGEENSRNEEDGSTRKREPKARVNVESD